MPNDVADQGDWLIPYDGNGGINDITAAMLIDAHSGVVDLATEFDTPLTLTQLDQMFADQFNGNLPADNPLPEPASAFVFIGFAALIRRRSSARPFRSRV